MLERTSQRILIIILTLALLLGAYLGAARYFIELQNRTVEFCVDLNDLKSLAAEENIDLASLLDKTKKIGVVSLGVFEETLVDANARGEIYYVGGRGIERMGSAHPKLYAIFKQGLINPNRTYIYAPLSAARKRIFNQLKWVLGKKNVRFLGREVIEVNQDERAIRDLGLGISEVEEKLLLKQGFWIIPRVWNDPRYSAHSIKKKISALRDFHTIIFDGEDILGYPDELKTLSNALKKQKIKYGYIEIVKQDGDRLLRRLMGQEVVRVHSIPKRELKKISRDQALKRFVRSSRERNVKLFYLRPFLPKDAQVAPSDFYLSFLEELKTEMEKAGFVLGKASSVSPLRVSGWQILILGLGVLVGSLFLLNHFIKIPSTLMLIILLPSAAAITFLGLSGYITLLQKGLALLAAVTFPSLAVISTFSKIKQPVTLLWDSILMVLNIVAETFIGVFLLIGLLADFRFMLGVETFSGVKLALLLPLIIVALYFIKREKGNLWSFLQTEVKLSLLIGGLAALAALAILVARSGNFILPVPAFEKYFRSFLEAMFFIRPRTKEFLIGYPALLLALRSKPKWLFLLASIGTIAPISVFNSFSHIHTPIMVSMLRTINGLGLGLLIGLALILMTNHFIRE